MRKRLVQNSSLPPLSTTAVVAKSYEFSLLTPMFGGDVESFRPNQNAPVRSQSVKGQLRFWWRSMQSFTSQKELLENETQIWGGGLAGKKCRAKVKVAVTDFKNIQTALVEKRCDKNGRPSRIQSNDLAPYVLFPVLNVDNPLLITQANFKITVTYPKTFEDVVLHTLTLWALFGGIGGRTRRGCGSVYSEGLFNDQDIRTIEDLKRFVRDIGQGAPSALRYARMKGARLFYSKANGTTIKDLQMKYGEYRQDRTPPQPGENHPGRSYWPEPDAIRKILSKNAPQHAPNHPDGVWFPRAAFGLPIMTKFNTQNRGAGDPRDTVKLEPHGAKRWPSPVIIKQLKLPDGLYNVMLAMNQCFPDGLTLDGKPVPSDALPCNSTKKKIMKTNDPLNGRSIEKALADALHLQDAGI